MTKRNMLNVAAMVGIAAVLAGCSTTRPDSSRVNLFADDDYRMTTAGAVVDGWVTREDGIWFSRGAVERLQRERILP
jgi:hypothetical protein